MTVVQENIDAEFGLPAVISLELWDLATGVAVAGFHIPTSRFIIGEHRVVTDAAGVWSDDLLPNDEISPAGTVWRITRHIGGCDDITTFLSVPASGGPYEAHDVTVTQASVQWLTGTGGNIPLVKVLDGSEYVWPTGVAPSTTFASIIFLGDADPHVTPGGRTHENDIWLNLT